MKTIAKPNRTVDPTVEPVSLPEIKKQLSLAEASSQWDAFLRDAIQQAREQFEYDTGVVCCTSTWAEKLDEWPADYFILHRRPVASVSSITYLDTDGASQTWASSNYTLDANRTEPTIFLTYGATFPAIRTIENAITITYVAGYGAATAVPKLVKQAILLAAANAFVQRTPFEQGSVTPAGPMGFDAYEVLVNRFLRSSYP